MQRPSLAHSPARPAQRVEQCIVGGILDGTFPAGTPLPGERRLARSIGVARPLLRETLHRLANEGWLTIAHGKPTRVNELWEKGGLGLLGTLSKYMDTLPTGFMLHVMEAICRLMPVIAGLVAARAPKALSTYLESILDLDDSAQSFVDFDWRLQRFMAAKTNNPVYIFIFNDIADIYTVQAAKFFLRYEAREASLKYYQDLAAVIHSGKIQVETVVSEAMGYRMEIWQRLEADQA